MSSSILLLLLAAAATVSAETSNELNAIGSLTGAKNTACSRKYECASCTEVRVCKPVDGGKSFEEVVRDKCTGSTPFCSSWSGNCHYIQSPECAVKDEFNCLSNGMFPHPSRCDSFVYCRNFTSFTYSCVHGIYDVDTDHCITGNGVCHKFNCYGKNGVKTAHPQNPRYFAICSDGEPIMVDKCPTRDHAFFDHSQSCKQVI